MVVYVIQLYIFVLTFVNIQCIHVAFIICFNSIVEESDKKSGTFAVHESVLNSPKGSNGQYELAVFESSMPSSCDEEYLESEAYRASVTNVLYETTKTELSAQSEKEVYFVFMHKCLCSFTISIRYRAIYIYNYI